MTIKSETLEMLTRETGLPFNRSRNLDFERGGDNPSHLRYRIAGNSIHMDLFEGMIPKAGFARDGHQLSINLRTGEMTARQIWRGGKTNVKAVRPAVVLRRIAQAQLEYNPYFPRAS
jgi:hypothetical protein